MGNPVTPIQPQDEAKAQKSWIPDVPEVQIRGLADRIKPVIRFTRHAKRWIQSAEGQLYYIKPVDPFHTSFIWDPQPTASAKGLMPLCDIRTYHTYGYHGLFKPSIAEVLAQIPVEYLNKVVAFEIVNKPQTVADLDRERVALDAGYHVATTRLYYRK